MLKNLQFESVTLLYDAMCYVLYDIISVLYDRLSVLYEHAMKFAMVTLLKVLIYKNLQNAAEGDMATCLP